MPPTADCKWLALAAAVALIPLAGCNPPTSSVEVEVCGDVDIPRQVDSIRVILLDPERERHDAGVVELVSCPSGAVTDLPVRLTFRPFDGEGWIRVQGFSEGDEVVRIENRVALTPDSDLSVRLPLNDACMDVLSCTTGQTCIQGACEVAPSAGRELSCQSDETSGTIGDDGGSGSSGPDADEMPDAGAADPSTDPEDFDPKTLCPNYDPDTGSGSGPDGSSSRG